ncbi:diadenylate cyclase CdaA [bacterium]|nr:diadenylate cyclase CdaA [candidate division CSSED10-310 bacterium]
MTGYLFHVVGLYIRVWDIVDILIVAYIIYRALLLMRGTLAFQILLGLSVLFLMFKGAEVYQLATLYQLLRQFWVSWVILIIVLFQPEVRRVLAQLGRQWFWRTRQHGKSHPVIDAVVNASETMASQRTGALIVWERRTGLANYREIGISLDAEVSSELLRSIFNTKSPLHDGAVIVSENRLACAGCFLPLTRNPLLTRSLGTRHRAAIGLTEDTDAAVIVVSEERGTISLALDGNLEKISDGKQLKRRLIDLILERPAQRTAKETR